MRPRSLLVLGSLLFLVVPAVPAVACSTVLSYRDTTFYTSQIRLTTSNFPDATALTTAADFWNDGCSGSTAGYQFPSISSGVCSGTECIEIAINYVTGPSQTATGGCAEFQAYQSGQNNGGTITVYGSDILGRDCSQEWQYSLQHELGHVLGLGHPANGEPGGSCFGHVMGNSPWASAYEPLDIEDCNHVDSQWYTPTEEQVDQQQADMDTCNASCATRCEESQGSYFCWPSGQTPILIDLDDNGFHLTNALNGVSFDINADGRNEQIAWTSGAGGDAFLCRDRNGDGRIGDGRELFGNTTPLANGRKAPNGFVALQELDLASMGGNDDGQLDDGDRLWGTLRLWVDADHDGTSNPDELLSLAEGGVRSIDLQYSLSKLTDYNGNIFRFRGKAVVRDRNGKYHNAKIYDVFLSTALDLRLAYNAGN